MVLIVEVALVQSLITPYVVVAPVTSEDEVSITRIQQTTIVSQRRSTRTNFAATTIEVKQENKDFPKLKRVKEIAIGPGKR